MSDPFFGELYLRSTRPFLNPDVTRAEGDFLRTRMPEGTLLDLGCGHGRHLAQIPGAIGVDRDSLSLVEAVRQRPVVRADLRALPFGPAVFDGGWCWYNSLGTFEEDQVPKVLDCVSRSLKPGALFIFHGSNRARAEAQPEAGYDAPIGDSDHLIERARFNFDKRRDEIHRRLELADGRVLEADFFIRYYDVDEWRALLRNVGLEVTWVVGGIDGSPLDAASNDVIVGAEKRGVR